jgi:hypothetical protein
VAGRPVEAWAREAGPAAGRRLGGGGASPDCPWIACLSGTGLLGIDEWGEEGVMGV